NLDAPPWLFTAPSFGALLTVTDAFTAGDRFDVLDFNVSLGLTSAPSGSANCGDDPVPCLSTGGVSSRVYLLGAGSHSITIVPSLSPDGGGAGYLEVSAAAATPEPGTWLLFASGLCALLMFKKGNKRGLIVLAVAGAAVLLVFELQPA